MNGAERREYQARLEADWNAQMNERMNEAPRRVPAPGDPDYCGPNMRGHRHDFSMKGNDGIRRCFYCCGKKPAVTA